MRKYENEKIIAFFGYKDYLSNHYNCQFSLWCKTFYSVEQSIMWAKAILFDDYEIADKISKERFPPRCKKLGRQVNNFNSDKWDNNKIKIVKQSLFAKFSQNNKLKMKLIKTNGHTLVEASPYDDIWGVKLSETDDRITDKSKWNGQNLLGNLLMEVRDDLIISNDNEIKSIQNEIYSLEEEYKYFKGIRDYENMGVASRLLDDYRQELESLK